MEEKLKIIDEICTYHPSYGVDIGISTYTGGFVDSGDWFVRKMLDIDINILKGFLEGIKEKDRKSREPIILTEEEKRLANKIHKTPHGYINGLIMKQINDIRLEMDRKLFGL